jgi:hypothetical protein
MLMASSSQPVNQLPDYKTRWELLERVAASPQLRRAARMQELLFYIAKRSLSDQSETLHEQQIGVDVFRRREGYDTSADNIVRTNVSDLRKRIEAYFDLEGSSETLILEIPRGSYIPVFRSRPAEPVAAELPPAAITIAAPSADVQKPSELLRLHRFTRAALVAQTVICVALALACVYFWSEYRVLHRSLFAWQYEPSVAEFWNHIFNASADTDVVLADASLGLLQDINKDSFSFDDYLNRTYISETQARNMTPEMHAVVSRIVRWNMGSQDEFKLANRILKLDPLGKRMHLYNARDYMPDLSNRDNVILIGGRLSNPWDELFDQRMNFTIRFDNDESSMVVNRNPVAGEQASYAQMNSLQYCVIGYLPNPNHNGVVLLIEGTGAEATEAAGNFLLSESQLSNLKKTFKADKFPYFEVLLKVTSVEGTPLTATVEAYRTYPTLH